MAMCGVFSRSSRFSDVSREWHPILIMTDSFSTSSPTLTPFGDSDFLLEEIDAFPALEDDPTSPEVDHSYYNPKGDILLLEAFLNDDPSLPPHTQGNYLPEIEKKLKVCEAKTIKFQFDNLRDLSVEDKRDLIMVFKGHTKRAIHLGKLSGLKGIQPEFYTHKILWKEDYTPAVQTKDGESKKSQMSSKRSG
ncbi:hypothetical protein Tco_0828393 [Tanacetum coccineum]